MNTSLNTIYRERLNDVGQLETEHLYILCRLHELGNKCAFCFPASRGGSFSGVPADGRTPANTRKRTSAGREAFCSF